MPRRLRVHLPGGFYHVTLRGNHQQAIFESPQDRELLAAIVAKAIDKYAARLHAYCWMSNHLHFLVQIADTQLSHPMRQIASEFARTMQSRIPTTGHFFERRYHAKLIEADEYLLTVLRYIHRNPVVAGIVSDPTAYPWSSHHVYVGARAERWVTTDFLLGMLSTDRHSAIAIYRDFVNSDMTEDGETISDATVIGSDTFKAQVRNEPLDTRSQGGIQELIDEACRRFQVDEVRLVSPIRARQLTQVRAWIAHQADARGVATRSEVARALGRCEGTLRHAIKKYSEGAG